MRGYFMVRDSVPERREPKVSREYRLAKLDAYLPYKGETAETRAARIETFHQTWG